MSTTLGSLATSGSNLGEKRAIVDFQAQCPLKGYRRLTLMMLDANLVVISPPAAPHPMMHTSQIFGDRMI